VSEAAPDIGGLRPPGEPGAVASATGVAGVAGRELFVRHARKDGRPVAMLRAVDNGESCTVEAEVYSAAGMGVRPGPYVFATAGEATSFVTEAVEALMYLGCDITAG
jgi:hypothetical protein